jgi:hypothetical protein
MGKATRNEELAEYYLRAAGVAAVWIDAEGHVGAQDAASVEVDPDRIVFCCERGVHFTLAYRLYEWKKALEVGPPAIAAKLEELADLGAVELTPHQQLRIRYAGRKVFQIRWSEAAPSRSLPLKWATGSGRCAVGRRRFRLGVGPGCSARAKRGLSFVVPASELSWLVFTLVPTVLPYLDKPTFLG